MSHRNNIFCTSSFLVLLSFSYLIQTTTATDSCSIGRRVKVALLGDSLMRHAYYFLDLPSQIKIALLKLNSTFPYDNIDYDCSAADSSMIADIRDNQLWPAIELQPDATFIFWDTDVSDISEWGMNPQDAEDLRTTFRSNVDFVVTTLLNYTNNNLALTGPSILGEDRVIKQDK